MLINIVIICGTYSTEISDSITGIMETRKGQMRLSKNADTTSKIILFFDELFDSFNGKKKHGLNSIISSTSDHISFWNEAYNKLRQMVFVEKNTRLVNSRKSPKCLDNWLWTIDNCKYLWNKLQAFGFSSLNLRHLNQDILENFFGQIRDNGHRNVNPTPSQFDASFKILLTVNLTSKHSLYSNCEESEEGKSFALIQMYNPKDKYN